MTGQWPTRKSGRVRGTLEEDWNNLDNNLRQGDRGLLKGDSLARLLWRARGVRNPADPPLLTEERILAWADKHHEWCGAWPTADSGSVSSEPEENWNALDMSLRAGGRGLPGGNSLAQLLARERQAPNQQNLPRLTLRQILVWADQYREQTGSWPADASEPLPAMDGERWPAIGAALRAGDRGLPGGDSLPQLLARERGVRNVHELPRLSIKQILAWADDHHRRTGAWPAKDSSAVLAEPGENWQSVDNGLRLMPNGFLGSPVLVLLTVLTEASSWMSDRRGLRKAVDDIRKCDRKKVRRGRRPGRERRGRWHNTIDGQGGCNHGGSGVNSTRQARGHSSLRGCPATVPPPAHVRRLLTVAFQLEPIQEPADKARRLHQNAVLG